MSLIGVIEKKIPDISDKTKELLELFNDESLKGLSNNELKDFFEGLDGADEDFMKFVDKFDSSKDVFEQYQQHMIDNGKATSTFSSITKKAGTAIKSIGASLASMGVMWLVGEAISLVVKGIDNYIHRVEKAQEAIDDSRSEYEEATSSIESMNSELETTKQRIEELESKGKLTFTEKAELENLKEQNSELERSIALEEKKQKTKANQTVNKIRQKKDTLSEDFEDVFDNYSRYKKEYEKTKQIGLEGLTSGTITQESFDAKMTGMDSQLNQYESEILDKIEKFEQYKQDIINKYGTNDISNEIIENYKNEFTQAISDDLNVPLAVGILWKMLKTEKKSKEVYKLALDFDRVFSLNLDEEIQQIIPEEIINIANERKKARDEKNWEKSDKLRNLILEKGFLIKDTKEGFEIVKK